MEQAEGIIHGGYLRLRTAWLQALTHTDAETIKAFMPPPTEDPVPLRVLTWSTTGPNSAWSSEACVQPASEPAAVIHTQVPVPSPPPLQPRRRHAK